MSQYFSTKELVRARLKRQKRCQFRTNKSFAITPENLPIQLRIVGRYDERGVYLIDITDIETGRGINNVIAIEFPMLTADNPFPEVSLKLMRPSFNMEVKAVTGTVHSPEE